MALLKELLLEKEHKKEKCPMPKKAKHEEVKEKITDLSDAIEEAEEDEELLETFLEIIEEKWATKYRTPEARKGMFKGQTVADLESRLAKLKASGPHEKGSKEFTKMKQINFALRAKRGWPKG